MKFKEQCKIIERSNDDHYIWLKLKTEKIAKASQPGQFVNIRVNNELDPLLRRPFSIMDSDGKNLELLILVKGKGTEILMSKKIGDTLNTIGPLGNSFPEGISTKRPVFIAGGVGLAPFLFLGKHLSQKGQKPLLLFGAKSKDYIPELKLFRKYCDIQIATEDGSEGAKGNVVELLEDCDFHNSVFYACGPDPMLAALTDTFQSRPDSMCRVEAYYSMENHMACGFGICKGCAIETCNGEIKLSCQDGPIFPWNEVEF